MAATRSEISKKERKKNKLIHIDVVAHIGVCVCVNLNATMEWCECVCVQWINSTSTVSHSTQSDIHFVGSQWRRRTGVRKWCCQLDDTLPHSMFMLFGRRSHAQWYDVSNGLYEWIQFYFLFLRSSSYIARISISIKKWIIFACWLARKMWVISVVELNRVQHRSVRFLNTCGNKISGKSGGKHTDVMPIINLE